VLAYELLSALKLYNRDLSGDYASDGYVTFGSLRLELGKQSAGARDLSLNCTDDSTSQLRQHLHVAALADHLSRICIYLVPGIEREFEQLHAPSDNLIFYHLTTSVSAHYIVIGN
jgi:hypothetical protein